PAAAIPSKGNQPQAAKVCRLGDGKHGLEVTSDRIERNGTGKWCGPSPPHRSLSGVAHHSFARFERGPNISSSRHSRQGVENDRVLKVIILRSKLTRWNLRNKSVHVASY